MNVPFINHSGGNAWRTVRTQKYIVGVTQDSPFSIEIDQPEIALVRGGEISIPVKIMRQVTPFDGEATVALLGLPKGVTVVEPMPKITKDSESVRFERSATDESLLGPVSGLTCEVHVPVVGGHIVQRSGRGTLRIDPQAE